MPNNDLENELYEELPYGIEEKITRRDFLNKAALVGGIYVFGLGNKVFGEARQGMRVKSVDGAEEALYGHHVSYEAMSEKWLKLYRWGGSEKWVRDQIIRAKQNGANFIDLKGTWLFTEPKPYVYDFTLLDRAVEYCKEAGIRFGTHIFFNMFPRTPRWVIDFNEQKLDQDGKIAGKGNSLNDPGGWTPSFWAPKTREHYLKMVEAVVRRYQAEPLLIKYNFSFSRQDLVFQDFPYRIFDYSRFAQEKFHTFLREEKNFSLQELNQRYGTKFKSWDEVKLPRPLFGRVDLRPIWVDFQEFRHWSFLESNREIFEVVRKYDKETPICVYTRGTGAIDYYMDTFKEYGAVVNFSNTRNVDVNEFFVNIPRRAGVDVIMEQGIMRPPKHDWAMSIFQGIKNNANIIWIGGMYESPALRTFNVYSSIFKKLSGADSPPNEMGGLVSFATPLCINKGINTRTWYYFNRMPRKLFARAAYDSLPIEWFSDYSPLLDDLGRFKIIFETGSEVLPKHAIYSLVDYVRKGGKLVLQGNSGIYSLEDGKASRLLLAQLGLEYEGDWDNEPFYESAMIKFNDLPSSQIFPRTKEVRLKDVYKIPSVSIKHEVLAKHDERPVSIKWRFGKGEVLFFSGYLDWNSPESVSIMEDLIDLAKVRRWVQSDKPLLTCRKTIRDEEYVLAFNYNPEPYPYLRFNYDIPGQDPSMKIRLSVSHLPAPAYRVSDEINPTAKTTLYTQEELSWGIPLNVPSNEIRVLKLTPV